MNMKAKCCCGGASANPCGDCTGTQDAITLETDASSCSCQVLDGGTNTIPYLTFDDLPLWCEWLWQRSANVCADGYGEVTVAITCSKSTGKWNVYVSRGVQTPQYKVENLDASTFQCIGGKIVGSASAAGQSVSYGANCTGLTATVTI